MIGPEISSGIGWTRTPGPRLYHLPPGADFAADFARGLRAHLASAPPETLGRLRLYLNTRRTARRIEAALEALAPATYLPRVALVSDLGAEAARAGLPGWDGRLRRSFALLRLTESFLRANPDFGPLSAAPGLALSLQGLLDELQAAGVPAAALRDLDLGDQARHWGLTRDFLAIVADHWPRLLAEAEGGALDPEARRRAAAEVEAARWAAADPGPVLAAGSTASTPATALLLRAIARAPRGAVVLPGWEPDMPDDVWQVLRAGEAPEHPQHQSAQLVASLGLTPAEVALWTDAAPPSPPRRRLLAEALRPAPVTDAWAARLPDLAADAPAACAGVTLLEAETPRQEAVAIALALATAPGTAALVTPDAALARRVTAELARWNLIPDDSGGRPLGLTPPGILLGLLAGLVGRPTPTAALAAALRHPLAGGRGDARARHVTCTRWLERRLLRGGPLEVDWDRLAAALDRLAAEARRTPPDPPGAGPGDGASLPADPARAAPPEGFAAWFAHLRAALDPLPRLAGDAAACAEAHLRAAEALSRGAFAPEPEPDPPLWDLGAGAAARDFADRFLAAARSAPGAASAAGYAALWTAMIGAENARPDPQRVSDRIRILGTLEARAERADVMVLAGLNEGAWPAHPAADPWLNRQTRAALGLAPPERRTGLAAHDFLMAANAPQAILSRSRRDDGGPTVASRWLSRLAVLVDGCAPGTLAATRARGAALLAAAEALDDGPPTAPALRPAPRPPLAARPRRLSVTQIETLIRDPYAVYAAEVLKLRPLDPLGRPPDARDRGTLLHDVMEAFAEATRDWPAPAADALEAALRAAADRVLARTPWPARRRLWRARLHRAARWFAEAEAERREQGRIEALETRGRLDLILPGGPFALTARADRIDRLSDGRLALYDYKTGKPPGPNEVGAFAVQLLLEAAIAQAGGFEKVPAAEAALLEYLGISGAGLGGEARAVDLAEHPVAEALGRLTELLAAYDDPATAYPARTRPQFLSFAGDYDHLSRHGEWTDPAGDEAGP